jgi:hypothetical protein
MPLTRFLHAPLTRLVHASYTPLTRLLQVLALGGAPFPHRHIRAWALGAQGLQGPTCRGAQEGSGAGEGGGGGVPRRLRVLNTYGVTEATVYQTICEVREVLCLLCLPLQPLHHLAALAPRISYGVTEARRCTRRPARWFSGLVSAMPVD